MYLIINNTLNTTTIIEGNYPSHLVNALLQLKQDIIIISSYSNTIKVPNGYIEIDGIIEYSWKEYPLPNDFINQTH